MTPLALLCYKHNWLSFSALEINRSFLILFEVNMLVTMLVPNNEFSLAVHTFDFHIFTVIYSSLHRFIWDQHSDQLPIGLIAQLVMGLWVQIPYRADFFFFSGLIFTTAQVVFITVKIAFIFMSLSAVHIYDFRKFTVINKSFIDQSCPVKMAGN